MSIVNGTKIVTLVSAANGDAYGDAERHLFRTIQALLQGNVINMTTTTPPGSPANGDTYIVATGGTGAWSGKDNQIAYWAIDSQDGVVTTGAWEFYAPMKGWMVYNVADGYMYQWNNTSWVKYLGSIAGTANQIAVSAAGVLSLPTSILFPGAVAPTKTVVTATATTTLNPATGNVYRVNGGNVAAVTLDITAGTFDGQEFTLEFVQGNTTASVITWGAHVATTNAMTLSATLNSVNIQRFSWDATASKWYASSAGVVGM